MSIDSVGMSPIPACSWHRAEYSPVYGSRIGEVVVELTSGKARRPGVNRGKWSCVALRQMLSAEKPQQRSVLSRDCHRYYSLSDWSELAFPLFERSSSENRIFSEELRLEV